jgi:zeta-carotene desaturase
VTLIEKRVSLGGRAGSIFDASSGEWVDNCQHVLMPCCTNLLDFYRRIQVEEKIRFYSQIPFLDNRGDISLLRTSALPAPLHCAPSFLRLRFLSLEEKLRIGVGLAHMIAGGDGATRDRRSARDWLMAHQQKEPALEKFWELVLVSALNEDLRRSSAGYAAKVFREAFLFNAKGWWLGIPTIPLSSLYGENVVRKVEQHQGRVMLRTQVKSLVYRDRQVVAADLADGDRVEADKFVLALHWRAAASLAGEGAPAGAGLERLGSLETSPITGIHLWFDRTVTDLDFAALPSSQIHWFFNKTRNSEQGRAEGSYLLLVTSASRPWLAQSKREILNMALQDLYRRLPAARDAKILKSHVIKEPSATFPPNAESDALRPEAATAIPNLYLAGDWLRTGWPATMEGAVRGGYLAAEQLLRDDNRPMKVTVPDLPPSGIMRLIKKLWR